MNKITSKKEALGSLCVSPTLYPIRSHFWSPAPPFITLASCSIMILSTSLSNCPNAHIYKPFSHLLRNQTSSEDPTYRLQLLSFPANSKHCLTNTGISSASFSVPENRILNAILHIVLFVKVVGSWVKSHAFPSLELFVILSRSFSTSSSHISTVWLSCGTARSLVTHGFFMNRQ